MRPTRHITTPIALALTLVTGLGLAPVARADPAPLAKAEAAIAASQSPGSPMVQPNPDEQFPGSRSQSPVIVRVIAPNGGFDWGDAGIGAGAALALVALGLAAASAATQGRRRRTREQHTIATH
jgi:hypothetical protein